MAIVFNGSEKPTLGVEIELQLIDPETKNLAQSGPAVLKYFKDSPSIKPEIICSNIEVITGICQDIKEVESDLTNSLEKLQSVCKKEGCEVASAGTHPFAQWGEQGITDSERYHALIDRLQFPVRNLIIFGLHIHVGIPSGEKVIAISNAMTTFIPHFLALSASSPYWNNQDTGLASSRAKIFEQMPTAGLPYRMINWGEFQRFMKTLIASEAIESIREVWWDIRPHPGFGTIENRICDGLSTLKEILSMVAFMQSLVVWLGEQYDEGITLPVHRYWIVRENKWRASRWGVDAKIISDDHGEQILLKDDIGNLMEHLLPVAKRLNCEKELKGITKFFKTGTSADRQRRIFKETGDYKAVIDNLVKEFKTNEIYV